MNKQYSIGFVSRSNVPQEMRSPICYKHLTSKHLNHFLVKEYLFEQNFGLHTFQTLADSYLLQLGCQVVDKLKLLEVSDIVISLKPTNEWEYMRPGSILIGWFNHCHFFPNPSQNIELLDLEDITICSEGRPQKLLYKNAYVTGECSVIQTLEELKKCDPFCPAIQQRRLAVVLGYGNVGLGATTELLRQEFDRIIVFTQRQSSTVTHKLKGIEYRQMECNSSNTYEVIDGNLKKPLIDNILPQADLIVNATIYSNSKANWTLIPNDKFDKLKYHMAFIDPIHQPGHGTNFTQTTNISQPLKLIKKANHSIWYNGCNGMPNYRYTHSSLMISEALLNNLDTILNAIKKKVKTTSV